MNDLFKVPSSDRWIDSMLLIISAANWGGGEKGDLNSVAAEAKQNSVIR